MEWGSIEYFRDHFNRTAAIMSREAAFAQCSIAIFKSRDGSQDNEIKDGSETVRYFTNLLIAFETTK